MPPLFTPAEAAPRLKALAEAWQGNTANEKAVFQMWWIAFCEVLGVPGPATPPTDDDRFELAILTVERDGHESTNYIDYWKAGHAAVEAKASEAGRSNEQLLVKAFGQVRNYAANIGTLPPYLMVVDVPKTAIVWDRWSGNFGGFAAGKRIALPHASTSAPTTSRCWSVIVIPPFCDAIQGARPQAVSRGDRRHSSPVLVANTRTHITTRPGTGRPLPDALRLLPWPRSSIILPKGALEADTDKAALSWMRVREHVTQECWVALAD